MAMTASKDWGPCACGCGNDVNKGDQFQIVDGSFFLEGHEVKSTRFMKALKPEKGDKE